MDLPEWYDENCTINEMVKKAGISRKRVYRYIYRHHLKCKREDRRQPIPEWYNSKRTIKEMSEISGLPFHCIYNVLSRNKLPYKKAKKLPGHKYCAKYTFEEFMKFYNKNLTAREMSLLSGIPLDNVSAFLYRHKLEYFRLKRDLEIGKWYSPERTVNEMSEISGLSCKTILNALYVRNLPFKYIEKCAISL